MGALPKPDRQEVLVTEERSSAFVGRSYVRLLVPRQRRRRGGNAGL